MAITRRFCFVWVGDPIGRIYRGLAEARPDKIFVLLERRSKAWSDFQLEKVENLRARLGGALAASMEVVEDEYEETAEGGEAHYYGRIISSMFEKIRTIESEIGRLYDRAEVIWDITGAPHGIVLFLPIIASLGSSERCDVVIQYVRRLDENDPIYHAPESSRYFAEHKEERERAAQRSLASWRQMESDDPGSNIRRIRFPRFDLDLLDERSRQARAKRVLFHALPSSYDRIASTREIKRAIRQDTSTWALILDAAAERRGAAGGRGPDVGGTERTEEKEDRLERSVDIWISTTIGSFVRSGLAEMERLGRYITARRTYCGDLFVTTVHDMMMKTGDTRREHATVEAPLQSSAAKPEGRNAAP